MENEIILAIANFGVPTLIAFYVLHRIEGALRELNSNIIELNSLIRREYIRKSPVIYK